ncbi:MAG: SpoIIE family protein phosphatase [Pseudonocardia sp.]
MRRTVASAYSAPVLERRVSLPGAADSPLRARRVLRTWLTDAGTAASRGEYADIDEDVAADVVLLASELCDNAVLHAGTGFEMALNITDTALTLTVTDHGVQPLERYLSGPRPTTGRAATHGRGLLLLERMSDAWGTRHDSGGHHTWFRLDRPATTDSPTEPVDMPNEPPTPLDDPSPASRGTGWPAPEAVRRLSHLSRRLVDGLCLAEQVTELLRRLAEATDLTAAAVSVDYDDGQGERVIATLDIGDGRLPVTSDVQLPLRPPLRGRLTLSFSRMRGRFVSELAELCASRVALSVQSEWLTGVDNRQRAWANFLSDASELLGQPREVALTAAIVPQIVVPRLGPWCVVHLYDATGHLDVAALTHVDDDQIDHLREAMSGSMVDELTRLTAQHDGPSQSSLGSLPLTAMPLIARGRVCGIVSVSWPDGRGHTAEEIMVLRDLSRRVSLAIDNAQHLAAHKATSQALQRALLPRAMPSSVGIEFAADYLPASAASAVGGDFYGVLELSQDARWLSFIGDVCGKGPEAAARTAVVRDVLGVLIRDGRPSTEALETLNAVLLETRDPYQFCTLAAAMITRAEPARAPGLDIALVLAGHEPLVLLRASGAAELVGTTGTALGIVPTVSLQPSVLHLEPGDSLIAYTDGVVEQRRRLGSGRPEQFGHTRLLQSASEAVDLGAAQIISHIRETMTEFGPEPQYDDIALLVVQATDVPTLASV